MIQIILFIYFALLHYAVFSINNCVVIIAFTIAVLHLIIIHTENIMFNIIFQNIQKIL